MASWGCSAANVPTGPKSNPETVRQETLAFDGQTWTATGERAQGIAFDVGEVFACGEENLRLIRSRQVINKEIAETMTQEQKTESGTWQRSGMQEARWKDGRLDQIQYANEEPHGHQWCWHPNGELRIHRQYKRGVLHGLDELYDDRGRLQAFSLNVAGTATIDVALDDVGLPKRIDKE